MTVDLTELKRSVDMVALLTNYGGVKTIKDLVSRERQ